MNTKKIISVISLIVIIGLAIYWMIRIFPGEEEMDGISSSAGLSGESGLEGADVANADDPFIALLGGVKNIDLKNLKLLSDPVFKDGLKNLSQPIRDRGHGRENPFATIGIGNLGLNEDEDVGNAEDEDASALMQDVFESASTTEIETVASTSVSAEAE